MVPVSTSVQAGAPNVGVPTVALLERLKSSSNWVSWALAQIADINRIKVDNKILLHMDSVFI